MSKAAFLSCSGDPYIATLELRLWHERWYDEVDTFYVCYNNYAGVPQEIVAEFFNYATSDPKVVFIHHPKGIGPGQPIAEMTKIATEDLVMLIEEDGYIFKPGMVSAAFALIESLKYDAVGSPRGSCGQEVWQAMQKKYDLDYTGYGDVGPNFWPNFFFCKREDLLATDMDFGSKYFKPGDYYKELDHTFIEDNNGDTFVWASMQMRYNGVRFGHIPQYHASPEETIFYERKQDKWAQDFGWIHAGSLSSGIKGYLSGSVPEVTDPLAKQEMETRVAFWKLAMTACPEKLYSSIRFSYELGLQRLITEAQLSPERIQQKFNIYKNLLQV